MPNPAEPYICVQCKYSTNLKKRMRAHLYEKKKPCPNKTGVLLTDEIKEDILNYHRYIPPKKETKVVNNNLNQTISNHNFLANFVSGLEVGEKMRLLFDYQDKKLLDFEDGLETVFEHRVNRLEQDKYPCGFYLSQDGILKLIDSVTKIDKEHIEKFNVLYDKTISRFKIYRGKDWESYLEDLGAKELVSLVKSYYLDTYEIYLIRNLHADKANLNRIQLKEHLEIYYQFISVFGLSPVVMDQSDHEVLGHCLIEGDEFVLGNRYMKLFHEEKNNLKIAEKNRIKRKIVNIIKENTIHNITELNKMILELLKIDDHFKQLVIEENHEQN